MTTQRRDNQHRSGFLEWVRGVPDLDSREAGLCAMDIDVIWHQWRDSRDNNGLRRINHLMVIEEKSFGADLTFSQRDTMWITHQLLVNNPAMQVRNVRGQTVWVKHWGYCKLRYSGARPDDSEWIEWNRRRVTMSQLIRILRFDLRPDTLHRMDRRMNHHAKSEKHPVLFGEVA